MNSKIFIVVGIGAWYLTSVLSFFILAPSNDDGLYITSAMGTAITGRPGFWVGDEFAPSFFLPTAFTYCYGLLLKLTMLSGFDFGALGFRLYQFLFILIVPILSLLMLRRLRNRDYGIRFLILITFLSVSYFVQSAASVRPEVLGTVLFILFLVLRAKRSKTEVIPTFILGLCGTMHPIFTLLALTIFAVGLIRKYRQRGLNNRLKWAEIVSAFALPFLPLLVYHILNFDTYAEQMVGRPSSGLAQIWMGPNFIWQQLGFWNHSRGIDIGLYSGYPAFIFLLVMFLSTTLVWKKRSYVWNHVNFWVCCPMLIVQWVVLFAWPSYLSYLGFSSLLASLIIVLLWERPGVLVPSGRMRYVFVTACFGLSMIFIAFHGGKFLFFSEATLTPLRLHSVMTPILQNPQTKIYTNTERLIPPLIDHFSDYGNIRVNFLYLMHARKGHGMDPDCLPPDLYEIAKEHSLTALANSDRHNTYWGLNKLRTDRTAEGNFFIPKIKGTLSTILLTPTDQVYDDNKNLIIRASDVTVTIDAPGCWREKG